MRDGVFTLDVSAIDSGFADDRARQLLDCWRASQGFLSDSLVPLSTGLVIFNGRFAARDAPEILFAGTDALASRILGGGWASHPARDTMDPDYRCLISQAYRHALERREPVFDLVSTTLHANGRVIPLRYHRLIAPIETLQGAPFLACYSFPAGTDLPEAPGKPGGEYPLHPEPRTRGHASPFVQADFPNGERA